MGWKFWQREQTDAERSLAALQQQASREARPASPTPQPTSQPASRPTSAPEPPIEDPLQAAAMRHMEQVTNELEALLAATPQAEQGTFMLEVTGVEVLEDGSVALVGGAHEGGVSPGQAVGALVLPAGLTHVDPSLSHEENEELTARGLLGARALVATVVSWDAAGPRLVVTGVGPDDLRPGAMMTR